MSANASFGTSIDSSYRIDILGSLFQDDVPSGTLMPHPPCLVPHPTQQGTELAHVHGMAYVTIHNEFGRDFCHGEQLGSRRAGRARLEVHGQQLLLVGFLGKLLDVG